MEADGCAEAVQPASRTGHNKKATRLLPGLLIVNPATVDSAFMCVLRRAR